MSDTAELQGKLEFIRDVECTTSAEKQAINEALTILALREKIDKPAKWEQDERNVWCSKCHETMPKQYEDITQWILHSKFCHECGAFMENAIVEEMPDFLKGE